MCDPLTASVVIGAGGTLFSAYSQNKESKYNAKIAQNNALINENLAKDAENRGAVDEANHRLKVAQMKSSQRAKFGATGADVNVGSALEVQADTAMMGELDALTIRSNAAREAYGYRGNAANIKSQSSLDTMASKNNIANTLLTGSSKVAGGWYQMGKR